jgi:hypothetical protein
MDIIDMYVRIAFQDITDFVEVKDNSARACLTTSADCQLAAAIINGSRTIGLSEGELVLSTTSIKSTVVIRKLTNA